MVATIIAALIEQEPNIAAAWESGKGAAYFLIYIVACCLPIIGNLVTFIVPIGVIIACFATGKGIGYNFPTFVLPLIFAYVVTFGLIFLSNSALNSLLQKMCPEVYRKLGGVSNAPKYRSDEIVEAEEKNDDVEDDELDDNEDYDDGL